MARSFFRVGLTVWVAIGVSWVGSRGPTAGSTVETTRPAPVADPTTTLHPPLPRGERGGSEADPPTEVLEEHRPNGKFQSRSEGKRDAEGEFIRHGVTTHWYDNGQMKSEASWRQGVQHGPRRTWYDDGKPWTEANYTQGLEDGTWVAWHVNGAKHREWHMVRGRFHGLFTEWHANGKKRSEVEYVDGKRQGPMTVWDEDGAVIFRGDFVDGVEQP